jgi:primosomal protein N''
MTKVEEQRKKLIASLTAIVGAEKANQMVNKIDHNIETATQAVSDVLAEKQAEQFHQIERALSEVALKAFDAGPHRTKDGHTEIRWPPAEKEGK